jgi:hypothetical protein
MANSNSRLLIVAMSLVLCIASAFPAMDESSTQLLPSVVLFLR